MSLIGALKPIFGLTEPFSPPTRQA